MSRRRHTPEQVVRKLREADRLLGEGMELPEVLKQLEVSEATYHRWRNQFGGMKADDVKRLKELEAENARLKRIVADQVLENPGAEGADRGETGEPAAPAPGGPACCRTGSGSRSGGRAGMSDSPARRSGASRSSPRMTRRCGPSCGRSRVSGRGGGTARRISICSSRAGRSTASGCSGCGARKGSGCRRSAANASGAGNRPCPGDRLRAERPDHVWAFDFQFDVTDDGRAVKLLYVVDEFTREALAMEAERRIDGDNVVDVLDRIVAERGTPPGVRAL